MTKCETKFNNQAVISNVIEKETKVFGGKRKEFEKTIDSVKIKNIFTRMKREELIKYAEENNITFCNIDKMKIGHLKKKLWNILLKESLILKEEYLSDFDPIMTLG